MSEAIKYKGLEVDHPETPRLNYLYRKIKYASPNKRGYDLDRAKQHLGDTAK